MSNPIGLLTVITQYPLLVIKGCLFLLVCFLSLKRSVVKLGEIFLSHLKSSLCSQENQILEF